jgi:hypothetical protein
METARFSETLALTYETTWHQNPRQHHYFFICLKFLKLFGSATTEFTQCITIPEVNYNETSKTADFRNTNIRLFLIEKKLERC